jgi:carbon storage regulator CsrA
VVAHCELLVTVVGIDGNTVRLGVTAPAEIGAYREELCRRAGSEAAPHDQRSSPITELKRAPLRPHK